ncbi:MAG: hypothetical protein CMN58_03005 [Solibacterales bacterium]|nr:hypothetical protein [Bryobacterales bacterium]|tara:strand:+ start:4907 stop:6133 length:1227 start_codon:yes stop_codon:yes gene_type:complete
MRKNGLVRAALVLVCAGAMGAAYHVTKTETLMAESATLLVDSLNRFQRGYTVFPFTASHRSEWHYFPESGFYSLYGHGRNGITFNQMDSKQAHFANALLGAGLSSSGFVKAKKVMALEEIVRVIEDDTTGWRDANLYHFTIFGDPKTQGSTWGWRVEGHHLSLNYTIKNGQVVSSTPTFFGANPHEIAQGPHKGFRVLSNEEDAAADLLQSLDAKQTKMAIFGGIAPYDIITLADKRIVLSGKEQRSGPAGQFTTDTHNATVAQRRAELDGKPQGIAASKLTDEQYEKLLQVIAVYANNMPQDVAAKRMEVARATPRDQLYFGWMGRPDRVAAQPVEIGGRTTGNREKNGNYYRVQSPTFLIEYSNAQNQSNHSHSVWRDFENDFGADLLALHYQQFDHSLPAAESAD